MLIIFSVFAIKSCTEDLYVKYVLDYDIVELKKICKNPHFATCEQLLYAEQYCDSYRFNKEVNKCKENN